MEIVRRLDGTEGRKGKTRKGPVQRILLPVWAMTALGKELRVNDMAKPCLKNEKEHKEMEKTREKTWRKDRATVAKVWDGASKEREKGKYSKA